jgi:VanZ family protein
MPSYRRLKIWIPVFLYITVLFLTVPFLVSLERFIASLFGTSLARLGDVIGLVCSVLLLAAVVYIAVTCKSYRDKNAYLAGILIAVLGYRLFSHLTLRVEIAHLVEYGILSIVFFYALKKETKESTHFFYLLFAVLVLLTGEVDHITLAGRIPPSIYLLFSLPGFYLYRARKGRIRTGDIYFLSALYCLLIGTIDELFQGWLPDRVYDPNDIFTNFQSGIIGLIFVWGFFKNEE